eukprot:4433769-Pyramimonas_sp.AAC.1
MLTWTSLWSGLRAELATTLYVDTKPSVKSRWNGGEGARKLGSHTNGPQHKPPTLCTSACSSPGVHSQ